MQRDGVEWLINHMGPYGVSALYNGIVRGYSTNLQNNNLIIENIMMNDFRNNTEYTCERNTQTSDPTILYVAGEYHCICIII